MRPSKKELYRQLRELDRHELRRVLIYVGGLLRKARDDPGSLESVAGAAGAGITYRHESVTCGKPGCKSCPHGPYWYAYYREDGKLRSRYIGRELPEEVANLKD